MIGSRFYSLQTMLYLTATYLHKDLLISNIVTSLHISIHPAKVSQHILYDARRKYLVHINLGRQRRPAATKNTYYRLL